MSKETKKHFPIGKLIAVLVIAFAVLAVTRPDLLPFLSPAQQQVLADFQQTYFTARNPVQSDSGSFDPLCLVSLVLLAAECWLVNAALTALSQYLRLKSRHAETIKHLVCNCVKYAVVIYAIIFGLSILGVNIVAVIASLGILGLIVGFGAQTLIEDVITGLFIIFEGQFHVGDIVTIGGFRGTVTAIGIRTTQVTDAGGNIKIVNNSDIREVMNMSAVASVAITEVGISYDADLVKAEDTVKQLLTELPGMYPEVFKTVPSYLGVQSLSASSVDLRVMAEVDETQVYNAQRLLNRELKLALDRARIEIPFQQVVVHQAEK